ncbi:hypothetical protein GWI33_022191 [Rhynchophorus ferrugineus]|uniref:Carbonyl reductase n=1 Tax=Rhynchophorus ferrugineus TaxID=354439 RepID=A0A834IQ94_RHYFE|nr:hypothetical protein GWI33_022191 [Rhynchophorus ferrugineus]
MSLNQIAVVTGSNKGIGYAIVKGLCEKFKGIVYLTARDSAKGLAAVNSLKQLGFNPLFHQLDITDENSINAFKDHIKTTYGGLDILINNAGVAASHDLPKEEQAKYNVRVNYFGTLNVCEALFPLLRNNAKVINISSSAGRLQRIPSTQLQNKFKDKNLTISNLSKLMEKYIKDTKEDRNEAEGWGTSAYVVSKVGLTALTNLQQNLFNEEKPYRNIYVNSVHPGSVKTDMNKKESELKGKYLWFDCRIVDWDGPMPQ